MTRRPWRDAPITWRTTVEYAILSTLVLTAYAILT